MNKWAIRAVLAVLLFASVDPGGMLHARAVPGASIEASVKALLAEEGATYRDTKRISGGALNVMQFTLPGCAEPLQVAASPRTFDAVALFDLVGGANDDRRFAYIDRVLDRPDRYDLLAEHLKHSALGLVAMTPYQADGMMLVIGQPHDCAAAARIDWSRVWRADIRLRLAQYR